MVTVILAGILNLIGLNNAAKDEDCFRKGFLFAILSLVISAAASLLPELKISSPMLDDLFKIAGNFFEVLVTFFVIRGIRNLAEKLQNNSMIARGKKTFTAFAIAQIGSALLSLAAIFLPKSDTFYLIAAVLLGIVMLAELIGYFWYLGYLARAKKMLA